MTQFERDLAKFAKDTGVAVMDVIRGTALDMSKHIIMRTPVDTGRARGNWQATTGSSANGYTDRTDPTGSTAISEATRTTEQMDEEDTFYLTNNLPYIRKLENGDWSTQAPQGMVGVTVQEFQAAARRRAQQA